MITRENTKTIYVGGVPVGGGHPIAVQSMTNTDTRDINATISQINRLAEAGAEIVRVAVPDMEAAEAFRAIKKAAPAELPLAADIHFDYRLAIAALHNGADKLRVNPGNIGDENRITQVAEAAKAVGVPIRVGVNGGSLEKDLLAKYNGVTAEGLAESALRHIGLLEARSFYNIILSVKASSIPLLIAAHKILAEKINYPLHIGVTEAGTAYRGTIRSSVGIGALLAMGIGDTIRVSLTGDPAEEVRCAREILQAMKLRYFGAAVISCPTCGRTEINLSSVAEKVEAFCDTLTQPLTIAVMGCAVNGPGEAREADFGVAGGRGKGVIFRKGEIVATVDEDKLADALIDEIKAFVL